MNQMTSVSSLYGSGEYREKGHVVTGTIALGAHRLCLQEGGDDIAATYIPLEKIKKIRRTFRGLRITVRLSPVKTYTTLIAGTKAGLTALTRDLIDRRNLKKRFFLPEWFDETG